MSLYEKISRYYLGVWFSICAIDGWAYLFFNIHLTGDHSEFKLLAGLVTTTYFWAFLKLVQTIGAISLLINYRPALGLALITPISAVLCLFYVFELAMFIPFAILIVASTIILGRAYKKSYFPLLDPYPQRQDK